MVTFPDLSNLSGTDPTIADFLKLPNSIYMYFWAWIIGGIWLIIVSTLYFSEKRMKGRADILSSMAVACFAIIILSTLGTILGVITIEIFLFIMVLSLLIIGIWIFSR